MVKLYLERSQDDVYGDQSYENDEGVEAPFDLWPNKEIHERFENWFREWHFRPKGIDNFCSGEEIADGRSLLEVFNVTVISYSKSKRKLNLNGRITVDASFGKSDIFSRTLQSPERVYSEGMLTLTGPNIAGLASDRIYIKLDIKDGKHQVCKRELTWSEFTYGDEFKFDHPISKRVNGKKGFVCKVQYAIFKTANLITVDIQIPKVMNEQSVLFKRVDAFIETSKCRLPKTTLFNWNQNNVVGSNPAVRGRLNSEGGKLALSKSLIACPIGGALLLELFFFNRSNAIVTKERVKFTPKCFGSEKILICSEYGEIIVNFMAYPINVHPATLDSAKYNFWRLFWPETFAE